MADATLTGRQNVHVFGDRRAVGYSSIAFASNGDVWDTGLRQVESINLTPTTNTAFGFTVSGGEITLVSGGALTFKGLAIGL